VSGRPWMDSLNFWILLPIWRSLRFWFPDLAVSVCWNRCRLRRRVRIRSRMGVRRYEIIHSVRFACSWAFYAAKVVGVRRELGNVLHIRESCFWFLLVDCAVFVSVYMPHPLEKKCMCSLLIYAVTEK
jgi:hypothetical protein